MPREDEGELQTCSWYTILWELPEEGSIRSDGSSIYYDDDIEEKIDKLCVAFSRLSIASSSGSSSPTLLSISSSSVSPSPAPSLPPPPTLDELLAELANVVRDSANGEVSVPQAVIDRIIQLQEREEHIRHALADLSSDSQEPVSDDISPTPVSRGYLQVAAVAVFVFAIVAIRFGTRRLITQ